MTTVGNYQPLPYLLPAAALRAGDSASSALRFGRAAQALVVLALLAGAGLALYDADSPLVSLLGPLLAVTPMTLFCGASLGGSALEIAGAIAFLACLLRLCRPGEPRARWWAYATLSGAVLVLSRAASPVWMALTLLLAFAWCGRRTLALRWAGRRAARLGAGVLVLAVATNRAWEAIYGSRVSLDTTALHAGLSAGLREWWRALPELVGKFGYLDIKLPLIVPLTWLALVLMLVAGAFTVSAGRDRVLLFLVLAGGLLAPVVFYALLIRPTGFGLQGRHVLPMLVAIPILAGEALNRGRDRLDARLMRFLPGIPVAVAAMQTTAWYVNARSYAVGAGGPAWFLGHTTRWAPPLGWWPWLGVTLLGGICLGSVALAASRHTPTSRAALN